MFLYQTLIAPSVQKQVYKAHSCSVYSDGYVAYTIQIIYYSEYSIFRAAFNHYLDSKPAKTQAGGQVCQETAH